MPATNNVHHAILAIALHVRCTRISGKTYNPKQDAKELNNVRKKIRIIMNGFCKLKPKRSDTKYFADDSSITQLIPNSFKLFVNTFEIGEHMISREYIYKNSQRLISDGLYINKPRLTHYLSSFQVNNL